MLYKVKASYKYQAEDSDELNFEVGEVIQVVTYEDPEDQVGPCRGQWWFSLDVPFFFAGGGLAHGRQGEHRAEGDVPGELHQANLAEETRRRKRQLTITPH